MSRTTENTKTSSKRKRNQKDDNKSESSKKKVAVVEATQPQEAEEEIQIQESIGRMNSSLLADHFAQYLKRHLGDLQTLETDEKYLPAKAILDTSQFDSARSLSSLPSFLEHFTPGGKAELQDAAENMSSPHTLVITSSGIRAAEITRVLRVFQSENATVSKLFAKHIKLTESIEHVKKTRIGVGVGTPARIGDLLDSEALKTTALRRIVVDGSYQDQKLRSIFDMKDLFIPLLNVLSRKDFKTSQIRESDIFSERDVSKYCKEKTLTSTLSTQPRIRAGSIAKGHTIRGSPGHHSKGNPIHQVINASMRKELALSFEISTDTNPHHASPVKKPLEPGQVDAAMQKCLDLQNAGVTLHSKRPFAALLLAPDKSTVLLTHLSISHVQHAEAELARLASIHYSQEYLWDCTLVSTWEPCAMCTGTLYWANIGRLIYAATEKELKKLTGQGNGENMTMSLPCREVLKHGQKAIQVVGPLKGWEEKVVEESKKWWKDHASLQE